MNIPQSISTRPLMPTKRTTKVKGFVALRLKAMLWNIFCIVETNNQNTHKKQCI